MYAQIRIRGQIDAHWSAWFEDLQVVWEPGNDETLLRGALIDQAALYGLLSKLRDLGLALLSVDVSEDAAPDLEPKASTPP